MRSRRAVNVVIRHGTVIDGSGTPGVAADVGIIGDRIAAVGDLGGSAGARANLVVFGPATVIDRATYEKPDVPASGIDVVMVNGETVWRDGRNTGARPGHVLHQRR